MPRGDRPSGLRAGTERAFEVVEEIEHPEAQQRHRAPHQRFMQHVFGGRTHDAHAPDRQRVGRATHPRSLRKSPENS